LQALPAVYGCSPASAPFEKVKPFKAGETGRVVRSIEGAALELSAWQGVRLIGI
jgi:hypothetical protein